MVEDYIMKLCSIKMIVLKLTIVVIGLFVFCHMHNKSFSGLLMPGLCVYLYSWRLFSVQERLCSCQADGGMW